MENGGSKGDVPEDANAHCPGTQSEEAGKADSCAGCPNQQICATAPKGPDPDAGGSRGARKRSKASREIVEEETEFEEEVMALPSRRSKIPATQGGRGGREGGTKRSAGRGSAPPPCPPSSGRTKSCSSGPSRPKKLSDIREIVEEETEFEEEVMALPSRRSKIPATQGGRGGREGGTKRSAGSGSAPPPCPPSSGRTKSCSSGPSRPKKLSDIREIVEEETEFEEEVMALPSRRSKIPATQGGRGGREGGTKRSAGRGSAPPPCPPSSGRTKSCSSGPSGPKKLSDISDSEFRSLRIDNPYARNRDESREDSLFYNDFQERVYHEVLMTNIQMVVPQLWIDMEHINKNLDYFAEAKEICSNLGLFPIMEFQHDYEPLLIAQFYATAHFSTGRTRKITWMTQGAIKEATLAEFAAILGYEDRGRNTPCGFRCHLRKNPAKKDVLAPLYIQGRGIPGKIKDLLPTYDILHRIFRETVAPRAGNKDEIHGFSVDLLFNTFLNRDSGTALDVMDYIWNEMVAAAHSRRVPPFAPYIMALIVAKCPPIARTLSTHPLIVHRPKALKLKKHSKPRNVKGQEVDEEENVIEADSEDADSGRDADDFVVSWRKNAQPSWAKRMEAKLKKIFYFQVDNQKRMYEAHVYAKKACARQKEMMEAQGLTISAGSETNITPEEQWISKHSHWDDDVSSSHRAPSTYDEEDFDDEED